MVHQWILLLPLNFHYQVYWVNKKDYKLQSHCTSPQATIIQLLGKQVETRDFHLTSVAVREASDHQRRRQPPLPVLLEGIRK